MDRRGRWLSPTMIVVWFSLVGLTFQWPGEVQKTIERVKAGSYAAAYQDIMVLKNAGTPEAVAMLMELTTWQDEGTKIHAARMVAELDRTSWQPVASADGFTLETTLVDWLDQPSSTLRITACDLLGQLGATDQRERVAMMVTDADLEVRAVCVRSLLVLYLGATELEPVKNLTVQLLSDPYFEVRRNAVQGLGLLGVEETFVSFLPLLESDNPGMRRIALDAVARIDPDKAKPFVIKALDDPDFEVRVTAVRALGVIGDPAAIEALEPMLSDPMLDMHVVSAMATIKDPAVGALLVELLQSTRLRNAALNALAVQGEVAAELVADELMTATEPDHIRILVQAASLNPDGAYIPGLKRILAIAPERKADILGVLEGIDDREALMLALSMTTDETPKLRLQALLAVGTILEKTGLEPAAEEVIVDALCDQDQIVRLVALDLVTAWRIEKATKLLVPLLESKYPTDAMGASIALVVLGESYSVPLLVESLESPRDPSWRDAASTLSYEKPARALEPLAELVDAEASEDEVDDDAAVIADVLGFVMQQHTSKKAQAVVTSLLASDDPAVRIMGARAAAISGLAVFSDPLSRMMQSDTQSVRIAIAPRLWHLPDEQGRTLVETALTDESGMVRTLAILSLERTGAVTDAEKIEWLVDALSDPDEFVRINAAAALRFHAPSLADRRDHLCDVYDRDLGSVEIVSAMLLLADAGATCLTPRIERLVHTPGTGPRAMVVEALRIGIETGAVTLTEKIRTGLGVCSANAATRYGEVCESLLDEENSTVEPCHEWGAMTTVPSSQNPFGLPMKDKVSVPAVEDTGGEIMSGVWVPALDTPVSDGGPIFVIDGALTVRVGLIEDNAVHGLPEPVCSGYHGINVLKF